MRHLCSLELAMHELATSMQGGVTAVSPAGLVIPMALLFAQGARWAQSGNVGGKMDGSVQVDVGRRDIAGPL